MFERLELLIGKENINKINNTKVLIIGIGGVGGILAETLVRNGILNITIIDNDIVDITNKNRQILALDSTLGRNKVDVLKERLLDINSNVNVKTINEFIDSNNINLIFDNNIDFVIDACDTVSTKILIIEECVKRNIKVISSMGMGKKLDLSKLKVMDIRKTSYDKIAKIIRKRLKDDGIKEKVMVLSSDEEVIDTKENIGSYSPLTNYAGLLIADYVIKEIIK